MAALIFDPTTFKAQFKAFDNLPDVVLQMYWDMATCFISDQVYGCQREQVQAMYLNLMTAHLAALNCQIANGDTPGIVVQATIDKVSVTKQPPPAANQFQWWLNLTPYGAQLLTLLQMQSVGGWYVGGSPERSAYPGVYGVNW